MSAVNTIGCTRSFSNKLYKSAFRQGPLYKTSFSDIISLYLAIASKTIISLIVDLSSLTTSLCGK